MSSSIPTCNISIDGENYYNPTATDIRGPLGHINVDDEIKLNAGLLLLFIIIYTFTKSFIALFFLLWCIVGVGYSIYKKLNVGESILVRPCIDIDGTILTKN